MRFLALDVLATKLAAITVGARDAMMAHDAMLGRKPNFHIATTPIGPPPAMNVSRSQSIAAMSASPTVTAPQASPTSGSEALRQRRSINGLVTPPRVAA